MISKVLSAGKSFRRSCGYVLNERQGAKVILAEGVRDYDHQKMAEDFELQAASNPNISSPVQHIILSFPPGEHLPDEKLAQIAEEYLKELQLQQTQYAVVLHQDKDHDHMHVILNRVGNDGKTIRDSFLGLWGKKAAQALTRKHELKQANRKQLKQTHIQQMNGYDRTRYEIYQAVCEALPKTNDLAQLEKQLKQRGIELIYKYKGQSKEVQGLSLKMGGYRYKASEIDRRLSYKNLLKIYQHKLQQNQRINHALIAQLPEKELQQLKDLMHVLIRPIENDDYVPKELIKKKRKHLSKGQHL